MDKAFHLDWKRARIAEDAALASLIKRECEKLYRPSEIAFIGPMSFEIQERLIPSTASQRFRAWLWMWVYRFQNAWDALRGVEGDE